MCNNFLCLEIYVQANIASWGDMVLLYCKSLRSMHKFYARKIHINYPNLHFLIIHITIYAVKKLLQKDAVSHITTKFMVFANKMCK